MSLHKLAPEFLHTGTQVLEQCVLVMHEDGSIADMIPAADAGDDVQQLKGWICPGFVNTHCHIELSHLKGRFEPGIGMVDFLLQVIYSRQADASLVQHYMQTAEEQMIGNGIVAVGDICNTADSVALKTQSQLYWHNFIEATGFIPATAKQRFDQALAVAEAFQPHFPPAQISLVPHAPYSVSAKLFELIQNHEQQVTCMHNQESVAEEQFMTTGKSDLQRLYESIGVNINHFVPEGSSSLQYSTHYLPMAKHIILVHNCYTTAADIAFLRDAYEMIMDQFSFCLCPNANLYIGNKLPDVPMLMHEDVRICLGTDSLASNHQLSILEEMKTLQAHYPQLALADMLSWATANGAEALGISERFGHFQTGLRPGVLWLEHVGADGKLDAATVQRLY